MIYRVFAFFSILALMGIDNSIMSKIIERMFYIETKKVHIKSYNTVGTSGSQV